jgi:hypothetical protein
MTCPRSLAFLGIALAVGSVGSSAALVAAGRPASFTHRRGETFDLVVATGQTLIVDTNQAVLADVHGQVLTFDGGDIFLDSLEVKFGGTIVGQGPNPLRFFINNNVKVAGTIRVSGGDAKNIVDLGAAATDHQFGGAGGSGGGDGGAGSPDLTQSNAKGGNGFGSKNAPNGGGEGGEASLWALTSQGTPCQDPEDSHGAGGGGGSFANLGLPGGPGTDAPFNLGMCVVTKGKSAVDPTRGAKGGRPGLSPFTNDDPLDNYLGLTIGRVGLASAGSTQTTLRVREFQFTTADVGRFIGFHRTNGTWDVINKTKLMVRRISALNSDGSVKLDFSMPSSIQAGDSFVVYGAGDSRAGELTKLSGGQGGGAGGTSIPSLSFPNPNYVTDRQGPGGGGGGGVLEIYCYGPIDLNGGQIRASGGNGATAAWTTEYNWGGGSGGGSGGLVRIQSAVSIQASPAIIEAVGGKPGSGLASGVADPLPPYNAVGLGHGGQGGMGIVQLHAPFDSAGVPAITFMPGLPAGTNIIPAPILGIPEFVDDPIRQRELWFGIK